MNRCNYTRPHQILLTLVTLTGLGANYFPTCSMKPLKQKDL